MASSLTSGKTVYLVLAPFDNADVFMAQLRAVFERHVPTVSIHSRNFRRIVGSVSKTRGMPGMRLAYIDRQVPGRSAAELRSYVEGEDGVSGQPFMTEIIGGLTRPLTESDRAGVAWQRPVRSYVDISGGQDPQRLFAANGWTDGLPIVVPTAERVAAMLAGTGRSPAETIGTLTPARTRESWSVTVEKVAVNAVMAGAEPEHLPVILALAASGVSARMSSVASIATLSVVNGPIRSEIGMNSGVGAMGPYSAVNATIGRAYGLLSQNLQGGSVPGDTYLGTLGNNYGYTATFAENEEQSPWRPLHVQHGFRAEESAVSLFIGGWSTITGSAPRRRSWQRTLLRSLTAVDPAFGPLYVVDPMAARDFVAEGFDTKEKLAGWLAENGRMTASEYWDNTVVRATLRSFAESGGEPYASRLAADPEEEVSIFTPEQINIAVLGGGLRDHSKVISGAYQKTVSIDQFR